MQNRISNGHLTNIKSENNVTNIEIKFESPLATYHDDHEPSSDDRFQKRLSLAQNTACTESTTSGCSEYAFHTNTSSILSEDHCNYTEDNDNSYKSKKVNYIKGFKVILTALSTISLSISYNNIYRLPKEVYIHGGVTFLIAYYALSILVGFPLIFLEFGIGQLIQSNCLDVWKAVPLFKGLGFLKVFITIILAINLPVQIGLAFYYFLWTVKFGLPFPQCSNLADYTANYTTAESCLQTTFLLLPSKNHNPYYFGIFIAILFILWFLIFICLLRKDTFYKLSTTLCFILVISGFVLIYYVIYFNEKFSFDFVHNIDWNLLFLPKIWFYAMIQVLFSTHLSFGHLETCFGHVFNKNNFFWSAIFYQFFSISLGTISFLAVDLMLKQQITHSMTDILIHLWIYNSAINLPKRFAIIFTCCYYLLVTISGICSMLTIIYVLGRIINIKIKNWILVINLISFSGFVLSSCILLVPKLQLIHIFDNLIISHIVYLITILQLIAFMGFYGCKNIYSDFEFILGQKISLFWQLFWKLDLLILFTIYCWKIALIKINLKSLFEISVESMTVIIVLIFAIGQICSQSDYNIFDKLKSILKPDRKWGPIDPIRRRDWVQWREKLDDSDGRRDFTLKRRATRDYTNSIMKNTRRRHRSQNIQSASSLNKPPNGFGHVNNQFRLTSIIDSFDQNENSHYRSFNGSGSVQTSSEGYGTIRNEHYMLNNKNVIEL